MAHRMYKIAPFVIVQKGDVRSCQELTQMFFTDKDTYEQMLSAVKTRWHVEYDVTQIVIVERDEVGQFVEKVLQSACLHDLEQARHEWQQVA